jgi:hypothetical protein
MSLIGNATTTDTISDFRKGGSYLTNNKPQATRLVEVIPLAAIKTISLTYHEQVHTIRECPPEVFDAFVLQYLDDSEGDAISSVNREVWNPFQRWRMINFLLDDGALEVEENMLVEVEMSNSEVEQVTA